MTHFTLLYTLVPEFIFQMDGRTELTYYHGRACNNLSNKNIFNFLAILVAKLLASNIFKMWFE